jgi:uncharacterized protein (TIGR01777 family)
MKILVSGSSGLVGSALIPVLSGAGHEVVRLVRKKGLAGSVYWEPAGGVIDVTDLAGVDAVVHLAGENIAGGRWTSVQKAKIADSRVRGTSLLADAVAKLKRRPDVMVSASAIGFYGDRGNEILREDSGPGTGFLPATCRKWEAAAEPASRAGIRVVHPRIGIVLAREGGALPKMALPFKLGAGGKIGTGQQYMSWIALDDLTAVILHCIENSHLQGPVNAVAGAVTNLEFTKALGHALKRPTLFPLPAFAARIVMGEMADGLLLASARVESARLAASGFQFRHRNLEETLKRILK